jgi:hypothetical protein
MLERKAWTFSPNTDGRNAQHLINKRQDYLRNVLWPCQNQSVCTWKQSTYRWTSRVVVICCHKLFQVTVVCHTMFIFGNFKQYSNFMENIFWPNQTRLFEMVYSYGFKLLLLIIIEVEVQRMPSLWIALVVWLWKQKWHWWNLKCLLAKKGSKRFFLLAGLLSYCIHTTQFSIECLSKW